MTDSCSILISLMWSHSHQNQFQSPISQNLVKILERTGGMFYSTTYMHKKFHDHRMYTFRSHDWLTDNDSTNQKQY